LNISEVMGEKSRKIDVFPANSDYLVITSEIINQNSEILYRRC